MKSIMNILRKIKRALVVSKLQIEFTVKLLKSRNQKRIYVLSVPYHGNLGDQAIAYAQVEYLKSIEPKSAVIEVYMPDVKFFFNRIKRTIKPAECICIHGGGNMGNQYQIEEDIRRKIIEQFPNNNVISFPETIYFTKDSEGQREFKITKEIYNKHKQLTIVGREQISYDLMKESFVKNNVIFTPDIVLYLNKQDKQIERKNVFICLRSDVEGIISKEVKENLISTIQRDYKNVTIGDTVVKHNIQNKDREYELERIWNEFRQAKVVVTDRLHGMIFAAITGTPCVVLNNYNHKVAGEYEWIKDLQHIKLINEVNVEDIIDQVNKLYQFNPQDIQISDLKAKFKELDQVIQGG